jgi:hypothetical protein
MEDEMEKEIRVAIKAASEAGTQVIMAAQTLRDAAEKARKEENWSLYNTLISFAVELDQFLSSDRNECGLLPFIEVLKGNR